MCAVRRFAFGNMLRLSSLNFSCIYSALRCCDICVRQTKNTSTQSHISGSVFILLLLDPTTKCHIYICTTLRQTCSAVRSEA